jgi:hypothetical protein
MSEPLKGKTILVTGADHFPLHDQQGRLRRADPLSGRGPCTSGYRQRAGARRDPSPSDAKAKPDMLKNIPAGRWAEQQEIEQALLFTLTGPT